jgi:hypothetical protein
VSEAVINTKILNLDDLETPESDIKILHKGVEHAMRILTVESFISQQRRAYQHQRLAEEKAKDGTNVDDGDVAEVVELIRDSVAEFFPTLPIDELPTQKLFIIFGWLNEVSRQINDTGSDVVEAVAEATAEGNEEAATLES